MSMGSILEALKRRKVLTVLGLLLTLAAAFLGASRTGSSYSYTSSSLLLPPEISAHVPIGTVDYTKGNPLFFLSDLNQSRDILLGALTAENVESDTARRFPGVAYTVAPDVLGSSPVVVMTTTGTSKTEALGAARFLNHLIPTVLTQLQVKLGIQPGALITAHSLTQDDSPTVSHKGQIREGLTAAAGVGLLAMFGIALIDGMAMSRRKEPTPRRSRAASPKHSKAPVDEEPHEGVPPPTATPAPAPVEPDATVEPEAPAAPVLEKASASPR